MSLSMYQASVPVFIRGFENLQVILDKALAHAKAKNFEPSVLVQARLAPDMFALARQVQIASDVAKACAARLAGIENPSFADVEQTIPELKERIKKTLDFLRSVQPAQIDGSEERAITFKTRTSEYMFKGQPYLLQYAIPNFFFHVTTAYAILRHNGVELGKADFQGSFS